MIAEPRFCFLVRRVNSLPFSGSLYSNPKNFIVIHFKQDFFSNSPEDLYRNFYKQTVALNEHLCCLKSCFPMVLELDSVWRESLGPVRVG